MSAELVHLSCWALLASMVVFLVIGGTRTFREYRQLMRDRRARRKAFQRSPVCRVSEKAFRYA
ncbi:hypothetical protein [Emcibacter sp. SYSU 3D8]|uniref:hypothetical protein n=1 Tax=Emcibacter sp. SYSU 3D8 TaxID=3133969 RepID=UPI0031FEBCD8